MSKNYPTDQAFPSSVVKPGLGEYGYPGINIRLYIATMMMQGLLANQKLLASNDLRCQIKDLTEVAYMAADELLKQQPEE